MTDIALRILLQAQNQASRVIGSVASDLARLPGILGPIAIAGAAVTAGMVAIGVAGVKMAGDFQQAILSLVAHAGLAKSQVDTVSNAILNMAPVVGRSPIELADAMYPILSAFSGITNQSAKAALSLDTLKLSFETVAGSTTNGEAVAQAAVGTFNALGLATNNAATNAKRMGQLFDVMDLTVQLGNMHWEQYKNVISKLAVSIQGTGISFNEASAALATMTNEGFSAQRAQTYLSNTFTTLAIKTNALAAHAKKLGIEFNASKYGPMSLAEKIQYLNQITDGNKQKLLALMGNNATALKTFNALSVGLGAYRSNLQALQHAHGALASSFATASAGFKFHLSQMKASFDVLLITIGQYFLPIVDQVVKSITPLITRFAQWLQSSGALKTAAGLLSSGLQNLVTFVTNLVNTGAAIVGFFQRNQWAADLLIAVLAGVTAGVLAFAITAIPALVAGFIAWAIAAGAAAVATIAATWPFILIGAVIAAVVFGIIMAIQHWGQIVAWLKGVWTAFSTWIGGFFSALGTKAHAFWNGLVSVARTVLALLLAVITAPFRAIGQLFVWLYNHNVYIKMLVDAIRMAFTAAIAWLRAVWTAVSTWIVGKWNELKSNAGAIFNALGTLIHNVVTTIASFLYSKWNEIKTATGNAFSQLGTAVHQKITDLWNWLKGFVSGWPAQAVQWGANLIKGLISGITGAVGGLFSAIGNIAHHIAGVLGFHSPPPMGPLRDADVYMPNMMKMFTHGIVANMPAVQMALNKVAAPMAASFSGPAHVSSSSSSYSAGGTIVIGPVNIYAGNTNNPSQLADDFIKAVSRKLRQSGNLTTWTSGGKA